MGTPTLIYETLHGSRAYGLAREGSDVDKKGVIVGPRRWYLGLAPAPEQIERGEREGDHVWIELRKLMRLCLANNPTMLEMLWTDEADHEVHHPAGRRLLDARASFLSKRVADTFAGYALSQLGRIRRHRRWLLEPPQKEPSRADYGLPERSTIPKDQLGAAEALLEKGRLSEADLSPSFLAILDRERRYLRARKEWQQYRQWLANRNPARAALEAKHGYDTKHAMHLVRLMRMGLEALLTGELRVRRPDAEELVAIRGGALSFERLLDESARLQAEMRRAAAATALPDDVDRELVDRLVLELALEAG